ncbi:MAG TPA: ABC transporter permease [Bacteroidota bacterium]|nr:ABC transporter permease [Bacteroidota bacterium]
MKIPFSYIIRSMWTRRLTTVLTTGGIALVAFVFAAVLMMAYGLEKTLVDTGSDHNLIILRKSASAELQSQLDRNAANVIKTQPEIAMDAEGKPLATNELFTIINLLKKEGGAMGNITVRGVTPQSMKLRPQISLIEGRMFTPGTSEIIVGSNIAQRFEGCSVGQKLKFGGGLWTIVGIFDGHGTGFSSEIWGDVEQMLPAFGRPVFSSVTLELKDRDGYNALKARIEGDPRLNYLEVDREKDYYQKQSQAMATFITILGIVVTVIFSVGAVVGAMITMYAAVANRTIEIGTMRALGFRRRSILAAFLVEGLLISLIGAAIGLFAASFLQLFIISTLNFGTFTELAFGFSLSPSVIRNTFIFAVVMGIVGGFLPAVRASRLNIVNALRAS